MLSDPQTWLAFLTLTALEIVLGIDNIIFISILVGRLPAGAAQRGRTIGLALAMVHAHPAAAVDHLDDGPDGARCSRSSSTGISGRDLILIGGGLFLLAKSDARDPHQPRGRGGSTRERRAAARTFTRVIVQIAIIDIVFSLDSVITAVGMADHVEVMIAAVVVAVVVMMFARAARSATSSTAIRRSRCWRCRS